MALESAYARRYKRIVEHEISGFDNANNALLFAKICNEDISKHINVKFRQYIGTTETSLAITKEWMGATILRMSFLDVEDQNGAVFICDRVKKCAKNYSKLDSNYKLTIDKTVVREKPQPQFIGK